MMRKRRRSGDITRRHRKCVSKKHIRPTGNLSKNPFGVYITCYRSSTPCNCVPFLVLSFICFHNFQCFSLSVASEGEGVLNSVPPLSSQPDFGFGLAETYRNSLACVLVLPGLAISTSYKLGLATPNRLIGNQTTQNRCSFINSA